MPTRVSRRTRAAFAGPAVPALLAVGIVPPAVALWKSLHHSHLTRLAQSRFAGLKNDRNVLTDPVFWQAIGRTALLCLAAVMATSTLIVVPVLIFALAAAKHRIRALTMGAVKQEPDAARAGTAADRHGRAVPRAGRLGR